MRKMNILALAAALLACATAGAENVETVRHAGPFKLVNPVVLDSVDCAQTKFSADRLIDTPLQLAVADSAAVRRLDDLSFEHGTLNVLKFAVEAEHHIKDAQISVKGTKSMRLYADGMAVSGAFALAPGYHEINVKFVADSAKLSVTLPESVRQVSGKRRFTMDDNLGMKVISSASVSASGRWSLVAYSWYDAAKMLQSETLLIDTKTGASRPVFESPTWMPSTDRYYYIDVQGSHRRLMVVDPASGRVETLFGDVPTEVFYVTPTEDCLVLLNKQEGPKKEEGVYEIVHPDDRMPDWRTRYSLSRLDLKTGLVQPLTYTYRQTYCSDISSDGNHLLLFVNTDSLTQRPTTRQSVYDFDMATLSMRQLVDRDGFISNAVWVRGTDYVAFVGSPEAFGGIGNRVPEGRVPSMFDIHLYLMNVRTGEVVPVTADDPTSIEDVHYSETDDCLYYTANSGDKVLLYRLDIDSGKSTEVAQPLECLGGMSVPRRGTNVVVFGSSPCVPYEAYNIEKASTKPRAVKLLAPNAERMADLQLGKCLPWSFTTERGYDVTGFYYLPADFDSAKKYPVIVFYYGGCSPTSRRFGCGSHYPAHYWNALGYIVFVVNPSGAAGFGQEWASRHVNTMGEGPAQDIIEATERFAADIPQVDAARIGCVSASYGGFMTQYMLTKSNPFACGVSHAGISDHTSYWGEGYWGYSYSETSAAGSYPWTRKDLYVDRSPLYNADKIHKPLLFTHGTADTNVPIGESMQMYTALRLLGTPTAFVEVEGENHGIMNPSKRAKWIDTIVAWFNRWLKDDDSWWNAIYEPKKL
ncbi:MAG: prolyl oligopeptidase family serine peptidase [Candidatus Limisoma sp.]|nr:prolyl oligopeptidase family serine peptidase [Candidatus Limisoma sp.]